MANHYNNADSVVLSKNNIDIKKGPLYLMCLISTYLLGAKAASQSEIERHLELGKDFLARGQLGDALTHYHAAVGEYPFSTLT